MDYRILLVDDEPDILEFVSYNLVKGGYRVETASNGREAVDKALAMLPHLILLDVMMPGMDGYETCRLVRSYPQLADTLIAFLTARSEDRSQIEGFDSGADDYIAKPIRVDVLVSRIKALLKRHKASEENSAGVPPVTPGRSVVIDHQRRAAVKDGKKIYMPRKEFALLSLLHSNPDKVFSRDEIFSAVWGNDVVVGDRTIDVHIRKLREKIGDEHIVTLKGVGYRYED